MKLFIPTLGRLDNQPTLLYLQGAGFFPTLVVQKHEEPDARRIYKTTPLMVLPPEIRTISPTRQYILDNCGSRYFAMFDDDLRFSKKRPGDRTKLDACANDDVRDMVLMMRRKLSWFTSVSISSREGNNRKEEPYYLNERIMRVLAYDRDRMPESCRFDRVTYKQDFDMTLQLLRYGLSNCVIYEYANDQVAASNARGGCSTHRTQEISDQAARDLQKLHPRFVTLTEKENNNWKGFGSKTRIDVAVAWKEAHAAGLRRAARATMATATRRGQQ